MYKALDPNSFYITEVGTFLQDGQVQFTYLAVSPKWVLALIVSVPILLDG